MTFKPLIGKQTIDVGLDGISMRELLNLLKRDIGEGYEEMVADLERQGEARSIVILVNGRNLEAGLETWLKEGDEVAIFPPMAGG